MIKLLLLVVALLGLISCSTNTLDPHMTQVGSTGSISIVDMRSQLTNKLLLAQVTFHNTASSAKTGFYRCQFFDANKMSLDSPQPWQPITIYPNEDQSIKCMATQLQATNFKVEFSADGRNVSVQKSQ